MMAVLMIRAGEHPSAPPQTVVVLESEVAEYERRGFVRVATDPGPPAPTPPPRARFNGWTFLSGTTGE